MVGQDCLTRFDYSELNIFACHVELAAAATAEPAALVSLDAAATSDAAASPAAVWAITLSA